MRTETRTVRIGENVGPIDWHYDFRSHFDCYATSDAGKQEQCDRHVARLRTIVEHFTTGKPIRATTDGGWPRYGIHRVADVGMYDGWPYWAPTPSVLLAGPMGSEWASFARITDIYPGEG